MKHIVITGGNRGIGLALGKLFKEEGHTLTFICRTPSEALQSIATTIIPNTDVTDTEAIQSAFSQIQTPIDILINNAGLLTDEQLPTLDQDAYTRILTQFEINALAPLKITKASLPLLNSGAKVILITSRMGSIEDNTSGGRYGYRASKAALNAFGKSLAIDLEPKGIAVGILHPGWVQTDMTGNSGHYTPEYSAELLKQRIQELNLKTTGEFVHADGTPLPW